MPSKRYHVLLSEAERTCLLELISTGTSSAQKLTRARILLKADQAGWTDAHICEALEVSRPTVERVRKAFVDHGLAGALNRKPRVGPGNQKFDGRHQAQVSALACASAPEGRSRWTLQLLADQMVQLEHTASISKSSVRQLLKKTNSSCG
jgi:transposase